MFNPESFIKKVIPESEDKIGDGAVDIVHIIDGGENGYIHPDEINSGGVMQALKTEESLDIDTINPDTGDRIKMCSNEPGNGVHQKGSLEDLFSNDITDDPDKLLEEVEKWKKENNYVD